MGQPSTTNQTTVRLLLILVAALALFGLITYYNSARQQHPKDRAGSERFNVALQPAAVTDDMRGQPFNSAPLSAPAPRMISSSSSSAPVASNQGGGPTSSSSVASAASAASMASAAFDVPRASEPMSNEQYRPVPGYGGAAHPADTFPQDQLRPEDLLPKDAANSKFAQVNPAGQGDVQDQNFLTAGFHMGTDTVGPSMRNASRDIRSTPPNPRVNVGIWNMSTITPDLSRRPLE